MVIIISGNIVEEIFSKKIKRYNYVTGIRIYNYIAIKFKLNMGNIIIISLDFSPKI